jgi:hypothetical protein
MASFMQDITQQFVLSAVAESTGEKSMAQTIQDKLGTATLKEATEALPESTSLYSDRISELLKLPASPERDAQLARSSTLQKAIEDAWLARINKLAKR